MNSGTTGHHNVQRSDIENRFRQEKPQIKYAIPFELTNTADHQSMPKVMPAVQFQRLAKIKTLNFNECDAYHHFLVIFRARILAIIAIWCWKLNENEDRARQTKRFEFSSAFHRYRREADPDSKLVGWTFIWKCTRFERWKIEFKREKKRRGMLWSRLFTP